MTVVHVALLDEGTPVWRPVEARHLEAAVYELLGPLSEGERWQFPPGQLVECELHAFPDGGEVLVARRCVAGSGT